MDLSIYRGDICRVQADAVCSSTKPHLELMAGTGGALRVAGGWTIQEECKKHIQAEFARSAKLFLPTGSVRRTSAGSLPFRFLYHCVAIDAFHGSSVEMIRECTLNALRLACDDRVDVLGMPVFASGNGQFDFRASLGAMLGVLRGWREPFPASCAIVCQDEGNAMLAEELLRG